MKSRVILLVLFFSLLFGGIATRLIFLQVLPNAKLDHLKKNQYMTVVVLPPQRGKILDRSGIELATSISSQSLFADPSQITAPKRLAKKLESVLKIGRRLIYAKLIQAKKFSWLKRQLDDSTANEIRDWKEPGLGFIEEGRRYYPNQNLLSQSLGFVGADGLGLEGLEKKFDPELRGEKQKVITRRDARGRPLVVNGQIFELTADGASLETTIDRDLQYELEYELGEVTKVQQAERATGIIMDPMTGEILALGSYPASDSGVGKHNHAAIDIFEPGSTFKIVAAAAALRSGRVQPSTKYFCENGKFKIGKHTIHEAEDTHGFGWLTLAEILEKSSNIGTTKVAFDIGEQNFRQMINDFGFNAKTGIDLPGESQGLLEKGAWPDHLLSNISFGHGVGVTALQIANAYSTVANGGRLMKPFLVKRVVDSEGSVISAREPQVVRQVLSGKESSLLTLMLSGVTQEGGTGVLAKVDGYPVAGKTGTAQKVNPNARGYMRGGYISSFAGFVPSNNPQFTIYVMIDHPKKQFYGAQVAAPLFQRLASFALHKRGFMPIEVPNAMAPGLTRLIQNKGNLQTTQNINSDFNSGAISDVNLTEAKSIVSEVLVPNLSGLTLREVAEQLKQLQVDERNTRFFGSGLVVSQAPSPKASWSKDRKIKVYFKK
jgi:cell division protein FtsI (penicillin-binding protein 3)